MLRSNMRECSCTCLVYCIVHSGILSERSTPRGKNFARGKKAEAVGQSRSLGLSPVSEPKLELSSRSQSLSVSLSRSRSPSPSRSWVSNAQGGIPWHVTMARAHAMRTFPCLHAMRLDKALVNSACARQRVFDPIHVPTLQILTGGGPQGSNESFTSCFYGVDAETKSRCAAIKKPDGSAQSRRSSRLLLRTQPVCGRSKQCRTACTLLREAV